MNDEIPQFKKIHNRVVIFNNYWEVIHDATQGGCPVSLIFFNGSRRNFLIQPVSAHIAVNEPGAWGRYYRQSSFRKAVVNVRRASDAVVVEIRGSFADENGKLLPADYIQTYQYLPFGLVRVCLTLNLKKPFRNNVMEISPCSFYVTARTNMTAIRPSGFAGAVPPDPAVEWREVAYERSYRDRRPPAKNYTPLYFCVFEKGVEGLEFYRGADATPWDCPFGLEPGGAVFRANQLPKKTAYFGAKDDAFFVENNVICKWDDFLSLKAGQETFPYSLGLPFIKNPQAVRRHIFHARVSPRPAWPDRATLKHWSDCGITLLRLHDDNTFVKPSWPDGLYPPYEPDIMQGMDQMIAAAHEFGMKVVPYFSLKEFHPSCPSYKANAQAWKRQSTRDSRKIECEKGPFGGYMCLASGWLEYRKQSIDLVLRKHKFDGVYYDHTWFHVCRHPGHLGGHVHTDVDQVHDFLRWTRERVGPDGFIFLHNSACPSMAGENLADLIYLGEHTDPSIPLPGRLSPDMEFVPIAPRNSIIYGPWKSEKEAALVHLLEGWPTCADSFTLEQFRLLSQYQTNQYRFIRAGERPVSTCHPQVYASLYYSKDQVVIYCANMGKRQARTRLCPDLTRRRWAHNVQITVIQSGRTRTMSVRQLLQKGLSLTLPSYGTALTHCKKR